jgi:hypothetical protein
MWSSSLPTYRREPSGLSPTSQWVTKDGPGPPVELGAVAARCNHRRSRRLGTDNANCRRPSLVARAERRRHPGADATGTSNAHKIAHGTHHDTPG